jgi:predicted NAD/FAD-binding protein
MPEKRKRWESWNLSKKDRKIYGRKAVTYSTKQMKKQ